LPNEYLQFRVHDAARFLQLVAIFERLKRDKEREQIDDPTAYLPFFDEAARSYFWWPTEAEYQAWLEQWYATPLEIRWTDQSLKHGWLFDAMVDALGNGEYDLIDCHLVSQDVARLEFYALAYPYGGTGCMQALIESFGFRVTEINDGSQPPFVP
jgi:hypothetical protein